MSFFAQAWAEKAPVANVHERAILTLMAHRAGGKDGCGAFPSQRSMAEFALCSDRQVRNVLADMQARGLIAPGDQGLASSFPPGRRPKVWDLLIPFEWYSDAQRAEVDEERMTRFGKGPLTPEARPLIPNVERRPAGRRDPK